MMKLLSEVEKSHYEENGFVMLRNVFTQDEIEEMSLEYDNLFKVKLKWALAKIRFT